MIESFGAGNAPFAITAVGALPARQRVPGHGGALRVSPIPAREGGEPCPVRRRAGLHRSPPSPSEEPRHELVLDYMSQEASQHALRGGGRPPALTSALEQVAREEQVFPAVALRELAGAGGSFRVFLRDICEIRVVVAVNNGRRQTARTPADRSADGPGSSRGRLGVIPDSRGDPGARRWTQSPTTRPGDTQCHLWSTAPTSPPAWVAGAPATARRRSSAGSRSSSQPSPSAPRSARSSSTRTRSASASRSARRRSSRPARSPTAPTSRSSSRASRTRRATRLPGRARRRRSRRLARGRACRTSSRRSTPDGATLVSKDRHAALVQFEISDADEQATTLVEPVLEAVAARSGAAPGVPRRAVRRRERAEGARGDDRRGLHARRVHRAPDHSRASSSSSSARSSRPASRCSSGSPP